MEQQGRSGTQRTGGGELTTLGTSIITSPGEQRPPPRIYTISTSSSFSLTVADDTAADDDAVTATLGAEEPSYLGLSPSKLVILDEETVETMADVESDYCGDDVSPLVRVEMGGPAGLYGAGGSSHHRNNPQNTTLSHYHDYEGLAFPADESYTDRHVELQSSYHCHPPRPAAQDNKARNQLASVSVLCLLFMVAEIVGGILSNSLALITDATHMASDLSGFLVSLFAIWVATKPPTSKMSFGFHRAEVLGALVSVSIIWVTTAVLFYLAVGRIINQDYEIDADYMLITAGLGVAFNIVMGLVLNSGMFDCQHGHSHGLGGGHGHSHGGEGHGHSHDHHGDDHHGNHSHSNHAHSNGHAHIDIPCNNSINSDATQSNVHIQRPKKKKPKKNINVRAAFIHVIGDLIQSIGVLIAAYIIKYHPEYKVADPICTFVFSVLVLFTTITILRDACFILMEGVPRGVHFGKVKSDLEAVPGVKAVHSLHAWALTAGKNAVSAHVAIGEQVAWERTLESCNSLLQHKHNFLQSTVQVESYNNEIMAACVDCKGPKIN